MWIVLLNWNERRKQALLKGQLNQIFNFFTKDLRQEFVELRKNLSVQLELLCRDSSEPAVGCGWCSAPPVDQVLPYLTADNLML